MSKCVTWGIALIVVTCGAAALLLLGRSPRFERPLEQPALTALFSSQLFTNEWGPSPQLVKLDGRDPMLIVPTEDGSVTALAIGSGGQLWQVALPCAPGHDAWMMADPVRVGDHLVLTYSWLPYDDSDWSHHAAVVDLRRGVIDDHFPVLEFKAQATSAKGTPITFKPQFQRVRSGLAHVPSATGMGTVYVGFGANRDLGIWHGWLYELDLDAWRRTGLGNAISGVFLTTPVTDCTVERKDCGGGIWSYPGPQVYRTADGYEILIQTGNGRLDLGRAAYAQSLIRLRPGLKFDNGCDTGLCSQGDPTDPSLGCLASCKNLFVPRLMKGDPPLRPADGSCEGKSFLKCLDINDWDFGAGAPVRLEADGKAFYVTASKAGGVYLLDADRLGTLYDREQAATLCGTVHSPCPEVWEGMAMAQPQIGWVDGRAIAVVPTFNMDGESAAGVVAFAIETGAIPSLTEIWRTPAAGSAEATHWFRKPPTRLVIADFDGEPVAWIGDNAEEGRLLAIAVRDGRILANIRTRGRPRRNSRPVIHDNMIYLSSVHPTKTSKTWVEAFKIARD